MDQICFSTKNDATTFHYFEAELLCASVEPVGEWSLCPRELIETEAPTICQSKGCELDYAQTWTLREAIGNQISFDSANIIRYLICSFF